MAVRELGKLKSGFNVRVWLSELGMNSPVSSDSVRRWVNVPCCYCPDHANHLGIHLDKKRFHCWLCGASGDILKLVQDMEGLSFGLAKQRLEEFQDYLEEVDSETVPSRVYRSVLPRGAETISPDVKLPEVLQDYLDRRKFKRNIIEDYGLLWCGPGSEYPLRLVVPVKVSGKVVSWQAADVTGKASSKYISCSKDRAVISNKEAVYGIDDVTRSELVVVVEGVTDRWRVGRERSVALFGKEWSRAQLLMLNKGVRKDAQVVVMLDPDAHDLGVQLGWQLKGTSNRKVKVLLLDEAGPDPGAMREEDVDRVLEKACSSEGLQSL